MVKKSFKTRLEIAKNRISKKNLYNDKDRSSSIGSAFKMSTELISAVAVIKVVVLVPSRFALESFHGLDSDQYIRLSSTSKATKI